MAEGSLIAANQDALDDLLVAIEASGGRLGIFIAVCDDPQLKEEMIARYEQALAPTFRHYRLTLDADEPSVKALLTRQVQADEYLQQGGQAVITILGTERLRTLRFEAAQSQQETFFGYLQWTREGLQDFPFAIVLWVTYQLQEQLSRKAPDFWSWRRDVIRFVSPKKQAIPAEDLSFLREQAQFSQLEAVGNTLPIGDLEALIEETAAKSPGSALLANLYLQAGRAYGQRLGVGAAQDYKQEIERAITYLKLAAQWFKSTDNASDYASSVAWLAYLYKSQGRYSDAESLYLEALEIWKAELGDRHPYTAASLNNLAGLYESQGRYSDAEPLYLEALEILKAELGDRHSDTAVGLNDLAALYYSQGRYSDAEPLYLEALEIKKAELGNRHPDTAASLNNLAALCRSQGRYSDAEPLCLEALEISKAELGDRHPYTATSLNNLAALYESQGRYSDAEPLYLQALEIWKAELGDRHPDTAASLNNLAGLYYSQGRYSDAEPLYLEALEIRKAELGDRHPSTATSLNNLALLYYNTDRLPEAAIAMSEAFSIWEEQLGINHPNTLSSRQSLETIQQAISQPASPSSWWQKLRKAFGISR